MRATRALGVVAALRRAILEWAGRPRNHGRTEMADEASDVWAPEMVRLFMSHTSTHKTLVSNVKAGLSDWGIDAFVAHEDIEPEAEWVNTIERALRTCDALVAFITPDFPASSWCDQEVGWAHGRQVPVLPLRMGQDPYGFIGRFQAIPVGPVTDAPDLTARITSHVVDRLQANPRISSKLEEGIVASFCSSYSFDATRKRLKHLSKVSGWTPAMVEKVDRAAIENYQIREALTGGKTVPEALQELLRPHRQ